MIKKALFLIVLFASLMACDNEIDLNADYEDTTVVFGLLNANADTQFVRITKTFLEDGQSAIDLAQDANRLFYNNIDVKLTHVKSGHVWTLKEISRPKEPGVFSTEKNVIHYIDTTLIIGDEYRLDVIQPDGKVTSGKATAMGNVSLNKPEVQFGRTVSFINNVGQTLNYDFEFGLKSSIAKFEARLYFIYYEVQSPSNKIRRQIEIPLGSVSNTNLENNIEVELIFPGLRFFETIANKVPVTSNIEKEIPKLDNLMIEVFAADQEYSFYQNINGPIDGLAQVRPEFTNIENGIGLFASRISTQFFTEMAQETIDELVSGNATGLTRNHNFTIQ